MLDFHRFTAETVPDGAAAAGLLYTAPTLGSTAAERFFALSIAGARKTLYMTNAGVRLYEWQPTPLHAKTFVVDGEWFTIGLMNFDNRSMALNDETTLMVLVDSAARRMGVELADASTVSRYGRRRHGRP